MRNRIILSAFAVLLVQAGCKDTKYEDVWVDRYLTCDTLETIDNWFLEDLKTIDNSKASCETMTTSALFLIDNELYIANEKGKCVSVVDINSGSLIRNLSWDSGSGSRTEAHDVYVNGDLVFVAAGNMRELEIFDRKTGNYLTRIGTGNWSNSQVSWAGCVAADKNFVYVRDSKYTNIRVFDRTAIDLSAGVNNTTFATLTTETHFIGSTVEGTGNSFDMEIIGDSLYAFLHVPGLIYSYPTNEIKDKKNDTPMNKTVLPQGVKVYSAYPVGNKVWMSLDYNGQKCISEYTVSDFQARRFDAPLRCFISNDKNKFPAQPIIAVSGDDLFFTNIDHIDHWKIVNKPTYIFDTPKEILE